MKGSKGFFTLKLIRALVKLHKISFICIFLLTAMSGMSSANPNKVQTGMFGLWAWDDWEKALRIVKDHGFDIAVGVSHKKNLDIAQTLGLKCIVDLGLTREISDNNEKWNTYLEHVRKMVETFKAHPAVFAWYPVDEPDWQEIPVERIIELRRVIRGIDQERPIFTVLTLRGDWEQYLQYFDIVSVDPYLMRQGDEDPTKVRNWIRKLRSALDKRGLTRPVWVVLGAFEERPVIPTYKSPFRKPTPEEFKLMVQNALDENVDAILVWTLSFRGFPKVEDWNLPKDDPELWNAVKTLPKMIHLKE